MHLNSKLPKVGTTIFTVMSQLAQQHQALNLSQGFPDFEPPPELVALVTEAMRSAKNQYAPMTGVPALRQAISAKVESLYGYPADIDKEITVTSGATEALFCAITAVVQRGDEVVLIDPAYDSYAPVVELCGGVLKRVPLTHPNYTIDWDRVKQALSEKTRLLVLNSPHNPTGSVLSQADIDQLIQLTEKYDFLILSDEVYEHIYFDQHQHLSVLRYPELRERAFVVSSFGKTYHCTGWKLGYCIAPPVLMAEFHKLHQYNTFASAAPFQYAFADYMQTYPQHYLDLPQFYQQKRDYFLKAMAATRFKALPCNGTYFQLFDYSEISSANDMEFAKYLIEGVGVAAIPISVFYGDGRDDKVLRFCFAKGDKLLRAAADKLRSL